MPSAVRVQRLEPETAPGPGDGPQLTQKAETEPEPAPVLELFPPLMKAPIERAGPGDCAGARGPLRCRAGHLRGTAGRQRGCSGARTGGGGLTVSPGGSSHLALPASQPTNTTGHQLQVILLPEN